MNVQCLVFIALGFIAVFTLLFYLVSSYKSG
jgi:hypothetical protein